MTAEDGTSSTRHCYYLASPMSTPSKFSESHLSASEHIHHVISDSALSLYALRDLRHHGMNDVGLQTVFRAVVVTS